MNSLHSTTLSKLLVTAAATMVVSTFAEAHWFSNFGWHHSHDTESCSGHHKGSSDHKGSKGSQDHKGSKCHGSKDSNDHKGSKGSHDHKGSKGSKGSHDHKGSKGSHCKVTGMISGIVFEDTNKNGRFDRWCDKRLNNITVTITDAEGKETTVKTNCRGIYCAKHIAVGEATVTIDENSFNAYVKQVVGNNPTVINVRPHRRTWEEANGFEFIDPIGNAQGMVFEDSNGNGIKDDAETGAANITVTITDALGEVHTLTTDGNGTYTIENLPAGTATVEIDPNTLPENAELTIGENPNDFTVTAGEDNDAGIDGYVIKVPVGPVGSISGKVFEDVDQSSNVTLGEPNIPAITVIATDSNGNRYVGESDANGVYTINNIPEGNITISIDESDPDLPTGSQVTSIPASPITVTANNTADIPEIGIYNPDTTYAVAQMLLFEDVNQNAIYDNGTDKAVPLISIDITDSNNNTLHAETDYTGTAKVVVPAGQTTFNVDDSDADLANYTRTSGDNPAIADLAAGSTEILYQGFKKKSGGSPK